MIRNTAIPPYAGKGCSRNYWRLLRLACDPFLDEPALQVSALTDLVGKERDLWTLYPRLSANARLANLNASLPAEIRSRLDRQATKAIAAHPCRARRVPIQPR